jgi:hypothetical protein
MTGAGGHVLSRDGLMLHARSIAEQRQRQPRRRSQSMNWSRAAPISALMKPVDRRNVRPHKSPPTRAAMMTVPTEMVSLKLAYWSWESALGWAADGSAPFVHHRLRLTASLRRR